MDKRKIEVKPRRLNLAVHRAWLKKHWPGRSWISQSTLTWIGMLMPSPRSPAYTVKLTYRLQERPKVTVISPILEIPEGKTMPHTFPGDELCLYFGDEWNPAIPISKTIIPWAAEWLLHYEIWLVTGEWTGGGIHPKVKTIRRKRAGAWPGS